jgi:hypothetical protein
MDWSNPNGDDFIGEGVPCNEPGSGTASGQCGGPSGGLSPIDPNICFLYASGQCHGTTTTPAP